MSKTFDPYPIPDCKECNSPRKKDMTIDLKQLEEAIRNPDAALTNRYILDSAIAYFAQAKLPEKFNTVLKADTKTGIAEVQGKTESANRGCKCPDGGQIKATDQDVMAAFSRIESIILSPDNKVGGVQTFGDLNIIRQALTQHLPAPTVAAQVDLEELKKFIINETCDNPDQHDPFVQGIYAAVEVLSEKGIIYQPIPKEILNQIHHALENARDAIDQWSTYANPNELQIDQVRSDINLCEQAIFALQPYLRGSNND